MIQFGKVSTSMPQTGRETPNYVYTVASEQVKNDRDRTREGSTCPRASERLQDRRFLGLGAEDATP